MAANWRRRKRTAARAVLEESLRQLAAYVQSLAGNDLTLLLSSGFQPVSTKPRADTVGKTGGV